MTCRVGSSASRPRPRSSICAEEGEDTAIGAQPGAALCEALPRPRLDRAVLRHRQLGRRGAARPEPQPGRVQSAGRSRTGLRHAGGADQRSAMPKAPAATAITAPTMSRSTRRSGARGHWPAGAGALVARRRVGLFALRRGDGDRGGGRSLRERRHHRLASRDLEQRLCRAAGAGRDAGAARRLRSRQAIPALYRAGSALGDRWRRPAQCGAAL